MASIGLVTILVLAAPPAPAAGVRFSQTTTVRVDGRAAGPATTTRVWLSGRRMRLDSEAGVLLVDLAAERVMRLDQRRKVAVRVDPDAFRMQSHMDATVAGDQLGAGEDEALRARPTSARHEVAGYPCRVYRLHGPALDMDICMAEQAPFGLRPFAELLEWSGADQAFGGLLAEIGRLPGFPVESQSRLQAEGHVYETRATLTELAFGPQSPSLFVVPPGWPVEAEEAEEP